MEKRQRERERGSTGKTLYWICPKTLLLLLLRFFSAANE